jgi:putative transposase
VQENVNVNELRMGSRRGRIAAIRAKIANELVEKYGLPLAEVARQLGVTTSAISRAISRLSKT